MSSAGIADELIARLPPDRIVQQGVERYQVDGHIPAAAIQPATIDEVAAVLRFASELGLAVIPRGSGLHMDLGNSPSRYDLALDLTRLSAVVEHSPEDLVVTVQAGLTLGALNTLLGEHGQFLALDTPLADGATVGGTLSAGLPGPSRLRYGGGRDLVIGLTCVLSSGEIVHSGGRVVKNVAGYDLNKLYLGALGGLGVIVEATFKLHPLPLAHAAIVASYAGGKAAHVAAMAVINTALGAIAVELAGPAPAGQLSPMPLSVDAWLVAVFLAGLPAAVERQTREATSIFRRQGASAITALTETQRTRLAAALQDYGRDAGTAAALLMRCNLLPSQIPDALQRLTAAADLTAAGITASPASGSLRLAWADPPEETVTLIAALRREVAEFGGTITVERCPAGLKRDVDVWDIEGPDVALMRDMKTAYDPGDVLSPGRFISRL
jgi:glycolate oxidase FAD binding subunit